MVTSYNFTKPGENMGSIDWVYLIVPILISVMFISHAKHITEVGKDPSLKHPAWLNIFAHNTANMLTIMPISFILYAYFTKSELQISFLITWSLWIGFTYLIARLVSLIESRKRG